MEEYRRKRASQIRPNSELCLRVKELESRDFKGKHVAVAPETGKRSNVWGGQSSLMTMVPSSAALWVQQCISQNLECTWSVELEDEHDNLKTVWDYLPAYLKEPAIAAKTRPLAHADTQEEQLTDSAKVDEFPPQANLSLSQGQVPALRRLTCTTE
eukprot:jgi/Botrbrau1/6841/Bobra.152_2s0004.3